MYDPGLEVKLLSRLRLRIKYQMRDAAYRDEKARCNERASWRDIHGRPFTQHTRIVQCDTLKGLCAVMFSPVFHGVFPKNFPISASLCWFLKIANEEEPCQQAGAP